VLGICGHHRLRGKGFSWLYSPAWKDAIQQVIKCNMS